MSVCSRWDCWLGKASTKPRGQCFEAFQTDPAIMNYDALRCFCYCIVLFMLLFFYIFCFIVESMYHSYIFNTHTHNHNKSREYTVAVAVVGQIKTTQLPKRNREERDRQNCYNRKKIHHYLWVVCTFWTWRLFNWESRNSTASFPFVVNTRVIWCDQKTAKPSLCSLREPLHVLRSQL